MSSGNAEVYILLETAGGYGLGFVREWDEVAQGNESVIFECIENYNRFKQMVSLVGFYRFQTAEEAIRNMTDVVEGRVSEELKEFLLLNLPKKRKKAEKRSKYVLGIGDPSLGKALKEIGIEAYYNQNTVSEILRGCRLHMEKWLIDGKNMTKLQVGLGHSLSRSRLKFDPKRQDKPIMECISLLDSLDKNINLFAMRVKEWYGWHFPELSKLVTDSETYCELCVLIGSKDSFQLNLIVDVENLKDLKMTHSQPQTNEQAMEIICKSDSTLIAEIVAARATSMGQDLHAKDLSNVRSFALQVLKLISQRRDLFQYLKNKLSIVAPNLRAVVGETLTARLIAHAGSLVNLAKAPASTVQILGAEKALFRALKTKGNTPKYGLLFQSTYIGRAPSKAKGRISRYLANKCTIAARLDSFAEGPPNGIVGEKLAEQIDERLLYLSGSGKTSKNMDVMTEAVAARDKLLKKAKKRKIKP